MHARNGNLWTAKLVLLSAAAISGPYLIQESEAVGLVFFADQTSVAFIFVSTERVEFFRAVGPVHDE